MISAPLPSPDTKPLAHSNPTTRNRVGRVAPWAGLLALALAGCNKESTPEVTSKTPHPPHRDTVSALGRIEPGEGVIYIAGIVGDRVQKVLVQPGQVVRAGEQLVEGVSEGVLSKQLEVAKGKLEQARQMAEREKAHAAALLAEADLAKRKASEVPPLQQEAQDAEVKSVEIQLAQAEKDLDRLPSNISQADKDKQTAGVDRIREQLRGLRAKLKLVEKEKELAIAAAEKQYDSTKAGLDKALELIDVSGAERQVAAVEAELSRASILSPVDGQVLEVNVQPGETIGQKPILTLARTDAYFVSAEIYEGDIGRVKIGQKAKIESIALPEPIEATVDRVGLVIKRNEVLGLDPAARSDTRVVEVRLRLDKPGLAPQRIGLQVDVTIATPATNP
jgi:HlyD family secretion protein